MSAFDHWYNGVVGFHINSERIIDDLGVHESDSHLVRKWMVVCWNNAIDKATELVDDDNLYDWDGLVGSRMKIALDLLKEKP